MCLPEFRVRQPIMRIFSFVPVLFLSSVLAPAQQPASTPTPTPGHQSDDAFSDTPPVVTHHQISVGGKELKYTATAGRLLIKPEDGPAEATMFFTGYTLDGADARTRPLTFAFNGGPGTSTAWLHMGSFGPKRQIRCAPRDVEL
jgi:carboxypeptidase C (cathepsin A)